MMIECLVLEVVVTVTGSSSTSSTPAYRFIIVGVVRRTEVKTYNTIQNTCIQAYITYIYIIITWFMV